MLTVMWQVAVSSQAVAHMSLAQRLNFGGAFQNYEIMNDALKREQEAWLKLTLLDDSRILTEGDWTNLHSAYAEAKTLRSHRVDRRLDIVPPIFGADTSAIH